MPGHCGMSDEQNNQDDIRGKSMSLLKKHGAAFAAIVLAHLKEHMPAPEWAYLRKHATESSPLSPEKARRDQSLIETPEQLVTVALAEDGLSMKELMNAFGKFSVEIARLEGVPVYYFNLKGIYAWSPAPSDVSMLSVWVTHPAYPPGW